MTRNLDFISNMMKSILEGLKQYVQCGFVLNDPIRDLGMGIRVEIGDRLGDCLGSQQRNRYTITRNVLKIQGRTYCSCKSGIQPFIIKGCNTQLTESKNSLDHWLSTRFKS